MFQNKARVLLVLPQDVLDRARIMAGKVTTTLKLPVSVQIVLRALIEEGLKRNGDRSLLANIEAQAQAVRRIRRLAHQARPHGKRDRREPGRTRRPAEMAGSPRARTRR